MPRKCECGRYASFGYAKLVSVKSFDKLRKRTHCGECKLPGMTNLNNYLHTCKCGKYANYGESSPTPWGIIRKKTHCYNCKTPGMVECRSKIYKKRIYKKRKYIVTAIGSVINIKIIKYKK